MAQGLPDIRTLSHEELTKALVDMGEKPFRTKQVSEWLWTHAAGSFDDMTSLGKGLRAKLAESFSLRRIDQVEAQHSKDGTVKCAFQIDGDAHRVVEGVLIPTRKRLTACISSQVGCSLACKFCATGRLKLLKNLTAGEMYDQVQMLHHLAHQQHGKGLSNIVYMGMGEPLLNYRNVIESVERITGTPGLAMSPKRITVSTAGIAKAIARLGDDDVKFNLALSLHAASDAKRNQIMAINETNNLSVLAESLRHFVDKTGTRPTFEFIVFKDFNDGLEDAKELAQFCKHIPCKINLIEYNPIDDGEFQQTTPERLNDFVALLEDHNLIVNVRRSRGKDIDAACGQLANKNTAGEGTPRKEVSPA